MDPTVPGFAEHLAQALTDALAPVADEAGALRGDLHAAEQARQKANRINRGVLVVLVVLVTLLTGLGVFTLRLASQARQTNARIADCTAPTGVCYRDGQARTGQAIADIIRAQVYVAECSRLWPGESGTGYDKKLEACVAQRLTGPRHPSPQPGPTRSGG